MLYRNLGRSGLKISALSLGSWLTFGQSVDDETTAAIMKTAYDEGVNFFDGAEGYGPYKAEEAMGRVLSKMDWPRDTLIISSKVSNDAGGRASNTGQNRKHLVEACDQALLRMNLDYLDLFFCHRPDPRTPLEETVFAMNELIRRGKIFYWGTSEFEPADLMQMHAIARENGMIGPLMEQTGYNMFRRERVEKDLLPLFERYGMGTTVYSPLCSGLLTGKYNDGQIPAGTRLGKHDWLKGMLNEGSLTRLRALAELADELGITQAELALAWVLKNGNTSTAIVGATSAGQMEENLKALDALEKLTDDAMERIAEILQ